MPRKGAVILELDYANNKYQCRGSKRSNKPMVTCERVAKPKLPKAPKEVKIPLTRAEAALKAAEEKYEKARIAHQQAVMADAERRAKAEVRARAAATAAAKSAAMEKAAREAAQRVAASWQGEPEEYDPEYGIVNPEFGPQPLNGPSFRRRRRCRTCR